MTVDKETSQWLGNLLAPAGTASDIADEIEGLDIQLFAERYVETRDFHEAPKSIN